MKSQVCHNVWLKSLLELQGKFEIDQPIGHFRTRSKIMYRSIWNSHTRAFEPFSLVVVKFPTPGPKFRSNGPRQG